MSDGEEEDDDDEQSAPADTLFNLIDPDESPADWSCPFEPYDEQEAREAAARRNALQAQEWVQLIHTLPTSFADICEGTCFIRFCSRERNVESNDYFIDRLSPHPLQLKAIYETIYRGILHRWMLTWHGNWDLL